MMDRLFVYGTLAPGRSNHGMMQAIPGAWEPATLKGYRLDEGWAARTGYPGIAPSGPDHEVSGYVFSSEHLCEHWARLDDFEGDSYRRIRVTITTRSGDVVEAHVYAIYRGI